MVSVVDARVTHCLQMLCPTLKDSLARSTYNWFQFVESLSNDAVNITEEDFQCLLKGLFEEIGVLGLSKHDYELIVQSKEAFDASLLDLQEQERMERAMNGEIVSSSEDDNPEEFLNPRSRVLIDKKRAAIRRSASRLKAKLIDGRCFLSRRKSKRVDQILNQFPDIGEKIEAYVSSCSVGADHWRTGILTFDGNARLSKKVTYGRIKEHLEEVYKRSFSYGTVVQMCVARNKRRRSSKRYSGVAKVTTRRARKGFNLRYNPDAHGCQFLQRSE